MSNEDPVSGLETEIQTANQSIAYLAQIGANTVKVQQWLQKLRSKALEDEDSKGLDKVQDVLTHFDAVIKGDHIALN